MDYDDTVVPVGEIGRKIVVARRRGEDWFIAGMCASPKETVSVPLDFLAGKARYELRMWGDEGATSARTVARGDALTADMAENGGFVAIARRLQ